MNEFASVGWCDRGSSKYTSLSREETDAGGLLVLVDLIVGGLQETSPGTQHPAMSLRLKCLPSWLVTCSSNLGCQPYPKPTLFPSTGVIPAHSRACNEQPLPLNLEMFFTALLPKPPRLG